MSAHPSALSQHAPLIALLDRALAEDYRDELAHARAAILDLARQLDNANLILLEQKTKLARQDAALAAAPTIEPEEVRKDGAGDRVLTARVLDLAGLEAMRGQRCKVVRAKP